MTPSQLDEIGGRHKARCENISKTGNEPGFVQFQIDSMLADESALLAEVRRLREHISAANIELSALIPNPRDVDENEWPCDNAADRECLQSAFEEIRRALTGDA